jgi:hypothetical protein
MALQKKKITENEKELEIKKKESRRRKRRRETRHAFCTVPRIAV